MARAWGIMLGWKSCHFGLLCKEQPGRIIARCARKLWRSGAVNMGGPEAFRPAAAVVSSTCVCTYILPMDPYTPYVLSASKSGAGGANAQLFHLLTIQWSWPTSSHWV